MAEVEFAGVKFKGGKIFVIVTALTTLIGGAYGAFEVYKDYMDMREKINTYVAPDLSGFHEKLAVLEERMMSLEDISGSHVDIIKVYGNKLDFMQDNIVANETIQRDMSKDLKDDVRRIEVIVEDVEDRVKEDARENEKTLKEEIDSIEAKMDELEVLVDEKIQKALENPLATMTK